VSSPLDEDELLDAVFSYVLVCADGGEADTSNCATKQQQQMKQTS
jgi:hypothetical protein